MLDALCDGLLTLYCDRKWAFEIALNNIRVAEDYKPDKVLAKFYESMDYVPF